MFGGDTLVEMRVSLQLAELEREGGFSPHVRLVLFCSCYAGDLLPEFDLIDFHFQSVCGGA